MVVNALNLQAPSQAPVSLPDAVDAPQPSQDSLVVTSHHLTQPRDPAHMKPADKDDIQQCSKGKHRWTDGHSISAL